MSMTQVAIVMLKSLKCDRVTLMYNAPEYRFAKNTCFCRACDRVLRKGEDKAVYFYSFRNQGMHVIICPKCVEQLYNLTKLEENQ